MLLVDTLQGKIIDDNELKEMYAKKQPYGEWLDSNLVHLKDIKIPNERVEEYTEEQTLPACRKPSAIPTSSTAPLSAIWH